jgi:S-adenosylmethionine/arginine decarboxylase-like enzyme
MIQHKHLLIRAQINNPILDTDQISTWISNLVNSIEMKVLHGPVSVYCNKTGNRGITGFAIIETSHIALHVWDECEPALAQLDVYTCSALNIQDVFDAIQSWNPTKVEYKYIDRENQLTLIEKSVI